MRASGGSRLSRRLLVAAVLALTCAWVHALDLSSPRPGAQWAPGRESFMPGAVRLPGTSSTSWIPKSVIRLPDRWPVGSAVRVCFHGGSPELRQRILASAGAWFQHVNLRLAGGGPAGVDCKPGSQFEIRIGFSEPGTWSYIGTQSLDGKLVDRNLSSMNLEEFDTKPPAEPRFTGIVLHEFGHALGLEHEHQSPEIKCAAEYNWPLVYDHYRILYGWSKDQVDRNVRPILANRSTHQWTSFDPKSIMVYTADDSLLWKGKQSVCYLQANDKLSSTDIQALRDTYQQGARIELLGERVRALNETVPQLAAGPLKDALTRQLQLTVEAIRQ